MTKLVEANLVVGARFGRLIAIGPGTERVQPGGNLKWVFRCDCGTEKQLKPYCVMKGGTKSCGCFKAKLISDAHRIEHAGPRLWYSKYKDSARNRGLEFLLSFDEFFNIVIKNCRYCNAAPQDKTQMLFTIRKKASLRVGKPHLRDCDYFRCVVNGVDRVDSSRGYSVDNCVSCCEMCNSMKLDYEFETWILHMKKVLENLDVR